MQIKSINSLKHFTEHIGQGTSLQISNVRTKQHKYKYSHNQPRKITYKTNVSYFMPYNEYADLTSLNQDNKLDIKSS